ncbi:hypothetical protein Btru_075128 [Bulinus truncatus]|nr:hypothetical protein Btru_075128 [Bulinus truncatus]
MVNDTTFDDVNSQLVYLANVNTKVLQIFSIILPVLGIPGNTIAVYVLHRQSSRESSTAVYVKSLCIVNMVSIILGLPRAIAKGVHGAYFIYTYFKYCTFTQWLLCTLMAVTSWHIVIINGCQLLHFFPVTKSVLQYITPLGVILLTTTLCALTELIIIVHGVGYYYPPYTEPGCYVIRASIWAYLHFVLYCVLPLVVLVIFNAVLYYINWKKETFNSTSVTAIAKRHLYLVIVLSSAHFMLTVFPSAFFFILPNSYFDFDTAIGKSQTLLVYNISVVTLYLGNSSNYIVYTCVGRRFRRDLLHLLAPMCPRVCSKKLLEKALAVSEITSDSDRSSVDKGLEEKRKSRQSSIARAIDVEDMNWRYDGSYRYTSSKNAMTIGEFYANLHPGRPGKLRSKQQGRPTGVDGTDSESEAGSGASDLVKHRSTSVDQRLMRQKNDRSLDEVQEKVQEKVLLCVCVTDR